MPKAHPEHNLQTKISQWVRECVTIQHVFLGLDAAKKASAYTRMADKTRGVIGGIPDTILLAQNLPAIAVELKWGDNKVRSGDNQDRVGQAIRRAGHVWHWTNSVEGYASILAREGVSLSGDAQIKAVRADALLASAEIRREEAKTGRVSRKRYAAPEAKPTAARLRKAERLRTEGLL